MQTIRVCSTISFQTPCTSKIKKGIRSVDISRWRTRQKWHWWCVCTRLERSVRSWPLASWRFWSAFLWRSHPSRTPTRRMIGLTDRYSSGGSIESSGHVTRIVKDMWRQFFSWTTLVTTIWYDWTSARTWSSYFQQNVTSTRQPTDMGMIASLKVGYKIMVLTLLLKIFDAEDGYESAHQDRAHHHRGCWGIHYGGKIHMLDTMQIIHDLWIRDRKYAREDGIERCRRKANILLDSWNVDIETNTGSDSVPACKKKSPKNTAWSFETYSRTFIFRLKKMTSVRTPLGMDWTDLLLRRPTQIIWMISRWDTRLWC